MILRLLRAGLLGLLVLGSAAARGEVPVPVLTGRVVDQTGTLDADQIAALDQKLEAFEARKGAQIAVLIVPSTAPEAIEQFSIRVADQWKLGRKKVDDGAILVVAKDDHTLRIEVGYGLEGALTDATCNRIIDEIIVPRFRQRDFAGGIDAGVTQMMSVVDGEPLPVPPPRTGRYEAADQMPGYLPLIGGLALVLAGVLPAIFGRLGGSIVTGGAVGIATWFFAGALSAAIVAGVVAWVFTLAGGVGLLGMLGGGGGWGGSGGGFRGGGGGFGGGGASGRW